MIVLDASAAIGWLTNSSGSFDSLADRIEPMPEFHVPELFDIEVMSALRGLERGGRLDGRRLNDVLEALGESRAHHWRHEELRPEIWRRRHHHSIYDAAYIALAKWLDLPLVTADSRLARSAARDVAVELFAPA